jgi:hypothetical protein
MKREVAVAAITPATIAVISSIECRSSFRRSFESAVSAAFGNPVPITYDDAIGLDLTTLKSHVSNYSTGMMVTFGGKIVFDAANSNASIPFISLVGTDPSPTNPNCLGGVKLDSYAANVPTGTRKVAVTFTASSPNVLESTDSFKRDYPVSFEQTVGNVSAGRLYAIQSVRPAQHTFRFVDVATGEIVVPDTAGNPNAYLPNRVGFLKCRIDGLTSADISLVYNPASPLATLETTAWNVSWPTTGISGDNSTAGPTVPFTNNFARTFANVGTKAAVISADPLFQDKKEALIQAANRSKTLVCYPLNNYRNNDGTSPDHGSMTYGPNLEDAIQQMGTLAGQYLSNAPSTTQPFSSADYKRPIFF